MLVRFTSACAESTPASRSTLLTFTVHLRLRGEHDHWAMDHDRVTDSPPPARRAQRFGSFPRDIERFTSACAESTRAPSSTSTTAPVHLRLRGEHVGQLGDVPGEGGSPPPARRARTPPALGVLSPRFTSACAESTRGGRRATTSTTVHLRLRGEHLDVRLDPFRGRGSPPPARRAHAVRRRAAALGRFTSACAESTRSASVWTWSRTVHLRLRGEHVVAYDDGEAVGGSPPPARRAQVVPRPGRGVRRFTSACAESTTPERTSTARSAVHLRLRGEHNSGGQDHDVADGSPPPARRAHRRCGAQGPARRFTSACAESTTGHR